MGSHQNLNTYTGSLYGEPRYQGIEYDWEVPDNLVVGSPGGVSSIHHHYTKGFYGKGNTSSDIYAGEQQRYMSGPYGNLYQSGQTASQAMGYYSAAPDYQFWQNEEPQQYSVSQQSNTTPLPGTPVLHGFPQSSKESFEVDPSFELIQSDADQDQGFSEVSQSSKVNIWLLLGLIFLIFVVFYLWIKAGDRFVVQYIHNGKVPSWQRIVMYATGASLVLFLILRSTKLPVIDLKL